MTCWSAIDLRQALLHEIEHVRRGDWAVYLLARTVCAFYWFLPLVWTAWRRLCLETERACDDAVVRQGDADAYVQQLVSLARRMSADSRRPVLAMASRRDLSRRVHAALDGHQRRGRAGVASTTAVLAAAGVLVMVVAPLRARAVGPQDTPVPDAAVFEVASVKPSPPRLLPPGAGAGGGRTIGPRAGTTSFTAIGVPLRDLLRYAYGLEPFQPIDGAPRWIDERFDVVAQMPLPDPAPETARHMMRALLADRFDLAIAWETREQPMYVLVPVRSDGAPGPSLSPSTADCEAWHAAQRAAKDSRGTAPIPAEAFEQLRRPACGMVVQPFAGIIHAGATTMTELAVLLSRTPAVGRSVTDRTGLDGVFDFQLSFGPDLPQASAATAVHPPLALALEEQLGLRLQPIRGPMDVLVIRHIRPPDED